MTPAKRVLFFGFPAAEELKLSLLCGRLGLLPAFPGPTAADTPIAALLGALSGGSAAAGKASAADKAGANAGKSGSAGPFAAAADKAGGNAAKAAAPGKAAIPGAAAPLPPMLILCGLGDEELSAFLSAYRSAGLCPTALKSVLTPFNLTATPRALCRELERERKSINKK